jgi:hypothetical protein
MPEPQARTHPDDPHRTEDADARSTAVSARVAFRRGETQKAYALLLNHVEDLLDTANMQGVGVAAIELVRMMHHAGRKDEVAQLLAYLEHSPLLESPFFRGLIWESLAESGTSTPPSSTLVLADDRAAAEEMAHLLRALIAAAR